MTKYYCETVDIVFFFSKKRSSAVFLPRIVILGRNGFTFYCYYEKKRAALGYKQPIIMLVGFQGTDVFSKL